MIAMWITLGAVSLLLIGLSIPLLRGKGGNLIAGYNMMPPEKKAEYDEKALCKFIGKILLFVGLTTPLAGVTSPSWVIFVYIALIIGLCVFSVIYANTGNRFKKKD